MATAAGGTHPTECILVVMEVSYIEHIVDLQSKVLFYLCPAKDYFSKLIYQDVRRED